MQLVTVWQSIAQIHALYGRQADTILTNHITKLFFGGMSDLEGLDYINRLLGEEHVPGTLPPQRSLGRPRSPQPSSPRPTQRVAPTPPTPRPVDPQQPARCSRVGAASATSDSDGSRGTNRAGNRSASFRQEIVSADDLDVSVLFAERFFETRRWCGRENSRFEMDSGGEYLDAQDVELMAVPELADQRPERAEANEADLVGEFEQCPQGAVP